MKKGMPSYFPPAKNEPGSARLPSSPFQVPIVCMLLGIAILAVYWQVMCFDFFDLDDISYVKGNEMVKQGLTLAGIKWAFTSVGYSANWHPLTWISHMLDVQLFGMNPGMHHFTSVVFHVLNSVLLFLVLERMTGAVWKSALVAALFALHPQHVESVAWISERKDVLSTFFWVLTLMAYLRYVRKPAVTRYVTVVLVFILGLLSKPMVVTLPFVLLLLDYWPLDRLRTGLAGNSDPGSGLKKRLKILWPGIRGLFVEKIPLIIPALVSIYLTIIAQREGGTIKSLMALPFGLRVENALISYVSYLWKMLCPLNLGVFYPYDHGPSLQLVLSLALILVCLTAVALFSAKRLPYLFVGWFWYIGTLVPVIGLVQVGNQSMADRYTYIPFIGIFILSAWGMSDLLTKLRFGNRLLIPSAAAVILVILGTLSWKQAGYWRDSHTLYEHTIDVSAENSPAHLYYAKFLMTLDELDNAERHCAEALKKDPGAYAYNLMGLILKKKGETSRAVLYYSKAIQIDPGYADAYNCLGVAYMHQGKFSEAYEIFSQALTLDPANVAALINMSNYFRSQGRTSEAAHYFNKAVQIKPEILSP